MIVLAILGGNEVQRRSGIVYPLSQEFGDSPGVFHEVNGIFEHIGINPLKDIVLAGVRFYFDRMIDMSMAEHSSFNGIAFNLKGIYSLHHKRTS